MKGMKYVNKVKRGKMLGRFKKGQRKVETNEEILRQLSVTLII